MIREALNTLENYENSIAFWHSVIESDLLEIDELLEDDKNGIQRHRFTNEMVIRNINDSIARDLFKIFKTKYSAGYPMSEVRQAFLDYLAMKQEDLDGKIGYLADLDILSVGILLDIDASMMSPFIENVAKVDYQDALLDVLVSYYRPDWPQHEEIRFKRPYAQAQKIMLAPNKDKALGALRHYVISKWYPGSNDAPWYNSHKSKNPAFHAGYWSFEAGALAKLLRLDDSSLEGQAYYPYDMVHWKEE